MKIMDFLREENVVASLHASSKDDTLIELIEPISEANPHLDKEKLVRTLLERETLGSTGIGGGVAIPHGKMEGLDRVVASFGRSVRGIDFNSMDNKPAHLFFLLVAPKKSASDHLRALARISRLLKDPIMKNSLLKAESASEIFSILEEYDLRLS